MSAPHAIRVAVRHALLGEEQELHARPGPHVQPVLVQEPVLAPAPHVARALQVPDATRPADSVLSAVSSPVLFPEPDAFRHADSALNEVSLPGAVPSPVSIHVPQEPPVSRAFRSAAQHASIPPTAPIQSNASRFVALRALFLHSARLFLHVRSFLCVLLLLAAFHVRSAQSFLHV
ncbi:MAG: hypothetical protein WBE41_25080 [Terracidiphilus sp.]